MKKITFCSSLAMLLSMGQVAAQWIPEQVLHPINSNIVKALPADLNGDGTTDMVALSKDPSRICWQLSHSPPNIFSLSEILTSHEVIYDVELADADADGDLDIFASVDYPTRIVWFENTGNPDALFREEELILQAEYVDNIQLEDINKDSIPDLSMSGRLQSSDNTNFHIMLGEGDGSFAPPSGTTYRLQLGLSEPPPFFFHHPEGNDSIVHLYANWRIGANMPAARISFDFQDQSFGDYSVVGDGDFNIRGMTGLNSDGHPELMGSGFQEGIFFYTYINGAWQRITVYQGLLANSWRAVFFDVDDNGREDIVFGLDSFNIQQNAFVPERLFWSANNGNFNFAPPQPLTAGIPSDAIIQFLPLHGGARESLFFYLEDEVRPGYKAWLADEEWGPNQFLPIGFLPGGFIPGDADDDGDLDLYCIDNAARVIFSFRNDANLRFNALHLERSGFPLAGDISGGDFNQDGRFDLLFSERRPLPDGRLLWLDREGAGWTEHLIDSQQYSQPFIFPEDMDGDGDLDIVATSGVHAVIYYPNEGDGQFGSRQVVGTEFAYQAMHLSDWDGDGGKDVIARVNGDRRLLLLHRWNGNGFDGPVTLDDYLDNTFTARRFAPFDLNQDQLPEIIGSTAFGRLYYWDNGTPITGAGQVALDMPNGTEYDNLYVQDIDGDGEKDLFFLLQLPNSPAQIAWLNGPADLATLNWSFATMDSLGSAAIFRAAPIFSNVPDLITYHAYDHTVRLGRSLMERPAAIVRVFFDVNDDGLWDSGDFPLSGERVLLDPGALLTATRPDGSRPYYLSPGTYTFEYPANETWRANGPAARTIQVEEGSPIFYLDFPLVPVNPVSGIELTGAAYPLQCSEQRQMFAFIRNSGHFPLAGEVMIGLDPLISIAPEQSSGIIQDDQHIAFPFENLPPGGQSRFSLLVDLPDASALGDTLFNLFTVRGTTPDGAISTDTLQLHRTLRCAYDPNDKQAYTELDAQGGVVEKGASIVYTIRFQNTGNAPARRVVLLDSLDEKLNRLSFRPLSASHDFDCSISEGGLLRVVFEDIQLPDSMSDPLASRGYFQFEIGQLPGAMPGDAFKNSADIYFDANPPIRTNTVVTQIPLPANTGEPAPPGSWFIIAPNPAHDWFELSATPKGIQSHDYRIVNIQGNTIAEGEVTDRAVKITTAGWPAGMYNILIRGEKGRFDTIGRIIVIH